MLMHGLGLRLGKTVQEIEAIPYREFIDWVAFFELTPGH
jgi:hypothetical protein